MSLEIIRTSLVSLPVDAVVDHMNFLMMAAHDTITSSATSLIYHLATNPEWQEKLRAEIVAVTGGPDGDGNPRPLDYDDLGKLDLTEAEAARPNTPASDAA